MYSAAAILSAFVSSSCSARSQAERELQQEVREPIEKRRPLGYATKLDRDLSFIREMMAYGERRAEGFQEHLRRTR